MKYKVEGNFTYVIFISLVNRSIRKVMKEYGIGQVVIV